MNESAGTIRVMIAGGGTGGHIFPAVAIAEEFMKRNDGNDVLFIGTSRGLEGQVVPQAGFRLTMIDVEGIKGRGLVNSLRGLLKIPRSIVQSWSLIRSFRPDIVIGVGGYASGPAVLTARLMGIKTIIAEQNAVPGITNRILARFSDRQFVSFQETERWFPGGHVILSGNPVRAVFAEEMPTVRGNDERFTLLIFGGSQGARSINGAVREFIDTAGDWKKEIHIIHQTGRNDFQEMSDFYRVRGVHAEVHRFITDMADAYRRADLLLCRSGATSIAEITVIGKASILVPYPYAVGDHQTLNAKILVDAGAAVMIPEGELDGAGLAEVVESLYRNPERRAGMERKARRLGNRHAASVIVDECMKLVA